MSLARQALMIAVPNEAQIVHRKFRRKHGIFVISDICLHNSGRIKFPRKHSTGSSVISGRQVFVVSHRLNHLIPKWAGHLWALIIQSNYGAKH